MAVGKEQEFLCTQHGEDVKASILVLLNLRFYPDRVETDDHPTKIFPKI
jgi:hypothetical protein